MRVFVTGATGLIGSATVRELLDAGHQVLGLARSDASATKLTTAGAEALRGDLDDLDSLRAGAAAADGVIHTAFKHDLGDVTDAPRADVTTGVQADRRAIEAFGDVLAGSDRPLVIASGTAVMGSGRLVTEDSTSAADGPAAGRAGTEAMARSLAGRGVRACAVRLPPTVHGSADKHGFIPRIIATARAAGVSMYPGDGANRWPAVHQLDAAHLFRLGLEHASAGAALHAVAEEGIAVREIAEVIGRHLDVPVKSVSPDEVRERLGFIGAIFAMDTPATSEKTREEMGWRPTGPGLIADLDAGHYFDD